MNRQNFQSITKQLAPNAFVLVHKIESVPGASGIPNETQYLGRFVAATDTHLTIKTAAEINRNHFHSAISKIEVL